MDSVLLLMAIVILICVLSQRFSKKLGVPILFLFILLGLLFGSEGILAIPFDNYDVANNICSVALIIIMFYGGFGTNWKEAKPVAIKAVCLSTLGVFLTAMIVGAFCFYILKIELLESFLIGSLISSTDAASVFSILRSKKLGLKEGSASVLEIESGSNDPCSYMLTLTFLSLMNQEISGPAILQMIFLQIFMGVLAGIIVAYIGVYLLKKIDFEVEGFDTALVLAISVFSYTLSNMVGGNGYLSTYMTGIILGNQWIPNKKALVHFFDGLTSLAQMLIFFLLGLLAFPSLIFDNLFLSLTIFLFLTFIARPAAIFGLLALFKGSSVRQKLLISFAGLRGSSSIVFAIMAMTHEAQFHHDLYHIVFGIVLFSILFQGTFLPNVAIMLKMVDTSNVLKTFNDYSEEADLHFIYLHIHEGHTWENKYIKDLGLPKQLIVIMVLRQGNTIVPTGTTQILPNDEVVLGGLAFYETAANHLKEEHLQKGHPQIGLALKDTKDDQHGLIVLIKRDGSFFIPNGETTLQENDILVYH